MVRLLGSDAADNAAPIIKVYKMNQTQEQIQVSYTSPGWDCVSVPFFLSTLVLNVYDQDDLCLISPASIEQWDDYRVPINHTVSLVWSVR